MTTKLINGNRVDVLDTEEARLRAEWAEADKRRARYLEREAAMAYRRRRKSRYLSELGTEPGEFENVIGDLLDIVISQLASVSSSKTEEFETLVTKIQSIKTAIPK